MPSQAPKILALSGGVGGAKLALGLSELYSADELLIVANTGDDFTHLGLRICPDIDTLMYNLAGEHNQEQGWGVAGETWQFMQQLKRLGGEDWFLLGDKDLATHTYRTQALQQGHNLTQVTQHLMQQMDVGARVVPMTNDAVSTQMMTDTGELSFQHYFVREQCQPKVSSYYFAGIDEATPQTDFMTMLAADDLSVVIICPSNPFVSVEPILSLPNVKDALIANSAPVIAVSPIVGGQALKGPAAKMMAELGMPQSVVSVAKCYQGVIDALVIDVADEHLASEVEALGIACLVTETVMKTTADKVALAKDCYQFSQAMRVGKLV